MAKLGRKLVEIDWVQFEKLCEIHCTEEEIAGWFRCSVDTIARACLREHNLSFAELRAQKAGRGKIGIRRKLFQIAMDGNLGALIWLSKQHLGMSEKIEQSTENLHLIEQAKSLSKLPRKDLLSIARDEIKRLKGESDNET